MNLKNLTLFKSLSMLFLFIAFTMSAHAYELKSFISDGTNIQYAVQGDPANPAVLLIHGFPDSHYLWRKQIPALATAGYYVLAIDLRGFGGSDRHLSLSELEIQNSIDDISNLLIEENIQSTAVVGHDIGGMLAWIFAGQNPKRVSHLISFTVGHPNALFNPLRPLKEMMMSWYYGIFIAPGSEFLIAAHDWSLFRKVVRNHSETAHWIKDLSRPGARKSAMNWFRANSLGLLMPQNFAAVAMPTLGVLSEGDLKYVSTRQMEESKNFVIGADFQIKYIPDASHWSMLDKPEHVNNLILNFIKQ